MSVLLQHQSTIKDIEESLIIQLQQGLGINPQSRKYDRPKNSIFIGGSFLARAKVKPSNLLRLKTNDNVLENAGSFITVSFGMKIDRPAAVSDFSYQFRRSLNILIDCHLTAALSDAVHVH